MFSKHYCEVVGQTCPLEEQRVQHDPHRCVSPVCFWYNPVKTRSAHHIKKLHIYPVVHIYTVKGEEFLSLVSSFRGRSLLLMPQQRLLLPFKSAGRCVFKWSTCRAHASQSFCSLWKCGERWEENILHFRMTGCEQDVMGAATECLLLNIVMSVATPLAVSDKPQWSDSPRTLLKRTRRELTSILYTFIHF